MVFSRDVLLEQLLLQNEKRIASKQATDSKVSRKFTFKVQDDTPSSGGKRRRVRRPDPEDGDDDESKNWTCVVVMMVVQYASHFLSPFPPHLSPLTLFS